VYTSLVRFALGRSAILAAGCDLARRDGIEALGVRSLAAEIGATPMALYRYVTDAAELRAAVMGQLLTSLPEPPASFDDLAGWAQSFRAWLSEVPGLSRRVLLEWFELPPLLDQVEALLEVFDTAALEGFELVAAANALFSYVLARGDLEEAVRSSDVRRSLRWSQEDDAARPLLASLRHEYEVARLDEHFDYGLNLLLRSLVRRPGGAD
jgi:AcrR family transcriptional regulator